MTTYFLDEFGGTGNLSGRTPDTGNTWATGAIYERVAVSGGKVVQNSSTQTNEYGRATTTGLVRPYVLQMGVKLYANTGPDPYSNSLDLSITPAVYSAGVIGVTVFAKTGNVFYAMQVESSTGDYQSVGLYAGEDSGIALGTGEHTVKVVGNGSEVLLYIDGSLMETFTLSGNAPNWASGSILHDFTWRRESTSEPTADLLYYYVGDTDYSAPPPPPPPPPDEDVDDETTTGDESAFLGTDVTFEQNAEINDGFTDPVELLSDETTTGDEIVTIDAYPLMVETATGTNELDLTATSERTREEVVAATDTVWLSFDATVEDLATGDEIVTNDVVATVLEAVTASEELTLDTAASVTLEDVADAADDALPVFGVDVIDEATGSELLSALADVLIEEVATADETVTALTPDVDADALSLAQASDELSFQVTSDALVVDTATGSETAFFQRPDLTAWVMNTETGAVSMYTNWAFTGMAQIGTKILAVGPQGLAILGSDKDDADLVTGRVEYDFIQFAGYERDGTPSESQMKNRVDNFWVGYTGQGRLQFSVETYGQGYGVLKYRIEPHAAAKPRTSRVTPGKGLNARWWKVAIENVNGAQFEVTSLSADVAQSNRRI